MAVKGRGGGDKTEVGNQCWQSRIKRPYAVALTAAHMQKKTLLAVFGGRGRTQTKSKNGYIKASKTAMARMGDDGQANASGKIAVV